MCLHLYVKQLPWRSETVNRRPIKKKNGILKIELHAFHLSISSFYWLLFLVAEKKVDFLYLVFI